MPRRLRLHVTAVIGAGLVCLAVALVRIIASGQAPSPWRFGAAAGLFVLGDLSIMSVRFGHDNATFTWSEPVMISAALLLPAPWLPVAAALGIATHHIARRREPVKVAFNTALFAVGATLFELVLRLTGGTIAGPSSEVRALLGVAIAGAAFSVFSSALVYVAVAFAQDLAVSQVSRESYGLRAMVCLGNVSIGVAIMFMAAHDPWTLLVLPLFLSLLYFSYGSYLRAMQERDTWAAVQSASRELVRLDQDAITENVLARAMTLFRAEFVELMLVDGEPGEHATAFRRLGEDTDVVTGAPLDLARGFWPRAYAEREPFEVTARTAPAVQRLELASLGLAQCLVAPLTTQQGCIGTLRVGFRGVVKLRERETTVFATFANHVTAAVHNARLHEAVVEKGNRLAGVLDNTSDGILAVDALGRVLSWNPAMERLTGQPSAHACGAPLDLGMVYGPEAAPSRISGAWLHELVLRQGDSVTPVFVRTEEPRPRWLQLSISPVRSANGELENVVIVVRDITALREAEEAKQDFLATVSHELRTPLTSLKGWLHTLLHPDFAPDTDQLRDIHSRMQHQTGRLQRLIEDLLSASSFDHGEFGIELGPVSVDDVVARAVHNMSQDEASRPVHHERAGLAGTALADAGRVEQVVANLLSNADKYCPAGTPVVITVGRSGADVLVSVRDSGPGISEDQHELVFERFTRLGHHMTREVPGTGLGLHIARQLVEAMGGRIWVESEVGAGSTFRFTLPAAPLVAAVDEVTQRRDRSRVVDLSSSG